MLGPIIFILIIVLVFALMLFRIFVHRGGRGIEFRDPFSLIIWPPRAEIQARSLPHGSVEISWDGVGAKEISVQELTTGKDVQLNSLMGEKKYLHKREDPTKREVYSVTFKNGNVLSAAPRFWEVPCVINLRDIGGYKTEDGRSTAWGKIYRTGHLGAAKAETLEIFAAHQIKLVCDLRSYRERSENPDQVPDSTTYMETSIYEDDQLSAIFPRLLFNRASLGDQLGAGYIRMLDERPEQFAQIIELVTHNMPAMFHCTAGKDRAGLTAALILELLRVPRDTIIADYSLSNLVADDLYNDFMGSSAATIERFGIPPEQLKPLFLSDPTWMANALTHLDETFDGAENYLKTQGNLSPEVINKLREEMLV